MVKLIFVSWRQRSQWSDWDGQAADDNPTKILTLWPQAAHSIGLSANYVILRPVPRRDVPSPFTPPPPIGQVTCDVIMRLVHCEGVTKRLWQTPKWICLKLILAASNSLTVGRCVCVGGGGWTLKPGLLLWSPRASRRTRCYRGTSQTFLYTSNGESKRGSDVTTGASLHISTLAKKLRTHFKLFLARKLWNATTLEHDVSQAWLDLTTAQII